MFESPVIRSVLSPEVVRRLRLGLSLAAGLVAILSMLGTFFGASLLSALGRGLVPMSPLAVGQVILLAGAILLMDGRPGSVAVRRLAFAMAAIVALLNLGFVVEHAQGGTTVLEKWLLQGWPRLQLTSLLTDLALLGAALAFLIQWKPTEASWRIRQAATLFSMIPQVIGVVVLVSYAAGAPLLYGTGSIPMSLPSALCALALGFSLHLVAGCDTWPLAAFRPGWGRAREWSLFGISWGALTLFLLIGTVVLAGGSFYLRGLLKSTRARVHEELRTISEAKVQQIGNWYGERQNDANQIAGGTLIQTQLRRFLASSPSAPPEGDLRAWMEALQKGTYRRVILFDGQGRARISVPSEEPVGTTDLEASEIQMALHSKEVFVKDLHQQPGLPDILLNFWVPIGAGPEAKAEGALLLMVDPRQFLYPLVQSWATASPSAETLLVRRDGDDVLFLNDLRHRTHTALSLRFSLVAKPDLPTVRAALGEEGLVEGKDYRGIPVLAVLFRVPGTDWHMVAKVDEAEIYGPLRHRVWTGVLGLVLTLILVSTILGLLLKHHDAEMVRKQLRLSQRFEWLMREANDIILLLDGEGHILEANAQAVERYGYDLAELLGKSVLELRASESRAEGHEQFEQMKGLGSIRFESIHQGKDGSAFPVEISARALSLDGEDRVISFVRDITERRAQEQEILRMTRLYQALSQVNQAIVRSPSRQALFDRICEVMVEFGQFSMAWIGLNDETSQRVEVAARYGDVHGLLDRISVRSDDSEEGRGAVGMAISQGIPCLNNDYLAAAESAPWREELTAAGLAAIAALPIREGGRVCGALVVYTAEKEFFGTLEAELLQEAATDISFALDNLAGQDRRRRAEAALQESERFLRAAQEAGGIGTYVWDIPGDVWKGSSYLDRIFGIDEAYPRILRNWTELVAPAFREQMQAYVTGIIERRERFDLEYPIIRKSDGELRWLRGTGEFQWDEAGRPVALMGVIRDITERRQVRAALQSSEEKFAKTFYASPDAVNINRLSDGVFVAVNNGFTRITGFTAEEVLGRSSLPGDLGVWVHAEDRLRLQEGLRQNGMVEGLEAPFHRKDGTVLTGLMSASLIEVEGEPCVLTVTRDITQLRAQTHQLEGLTQMYAALSQVNQAIIFSPTREALLDRVCEVRVKFGGFSMAWIGWNDPVTHEVRVVSRHGDVNGYLDGIQVRSDDTITGRGPTGRAIREGVPQVENDFLSNSDATPWHAAALRCGYAASASFPIRQEGEVCGAMMVYSAEKGIFGPHEVALLEEAANDISFALDHLAGEAHRQSLEAQLHQSQKLESLGSLAGGVAHDMNNVLGAILSLASALREGAEPVSSTAKSLDTIMSACMRGRGVVKSLLYFAQKDLQEERPIDLNDLAKEMSQLLSQITLQRVQLTMDLQEDLGFVRGDAGALSHALMNLCVNAIDAMPGGGTLSIQTTAAPDGGVILRVMDTGEGMAPEVLAKAVEPFFTTKPQGKGTGLGLAMVYGTMKAHEGTFDLHSQPGEGTEAVLRFPRRRVERPSQKPEIVPAVVERPQAGLKVLLVDDDELIRESVASVLEILGHQVTAAPGGRQALQLLEEGLGVDLVILDMNMPGMSGTEALPRILDLRPGLPVLLATGYSEDELVPLMAGRPTVSSLRKPFSLKEVRSKIASLQIQPGPDPRS